MYFNQGDAEVRCEWGKEGVRQLAETSDAIIIVDVISFSTSVDVALERAARVYPFTWKDERAAALAHQVGAILAVGSRQDPQAFSLAPSSMLRLPVGSSVVLPSPNGATLSLATGSTPTFAGCLRNAGAIAAAAAGLGRRISVIPAGERWPDGTLRPALEDLLGAGAIIQALPGRRSPEAEAAAVVYLHFKERLLETLAICGSGQEAADRGSMDDISLAGALNASPLAPRLVDGAYQV